MTHRFQIDLRGIIGLLSHHLYSGPHVFLRELLQNAADAIRARQQLGPHEGSIRIELVGQGETPALVMEDDGIGLTEEEVHELVAPPGRSSKTNPNDLRSNFIGKFGIGLLSCFLVSDDIVLITRSARGDAPPVEWRGHPDGTYEVRTLERDLRPGTRVYLRCKPGCEEYFAEQRVRELAVHYGDLLPFPISLCCGAKVDRINRGRLPWHESHPTEAARRAPLLEYGSECLGEAFLDCFPLRSEAGDVEGDAKVQLCEDAVAFAWPLAQHDRDPTLFGPDDVHYLLWFYQWTVYNPVKLPEISREPIERTFADMQRRYTEHGESLRAVYQLFKRRYEEALKEAAPLLTGRLRCALVPARTYALLLLPLVRLGRVDEAMELHRKGIRRVAGKRTCLVSLADHMAFLAVTANYSSALRMLQHYIRWGGETCDGLAQFHFLCATRLLMSRLIADGRASVTMRIPKAVDIYDPRGTYAADALQTWAARQAVSLASRFDRRNGNDHYARRMREYEAIERLATPCPLKAERCLA